MRIETTVKTKTSPDQEGTVRAPRPRQAELPFRLLEQDLGPERREIFVEGELDRAVVEGLVAAIERARETPSVLIDLARCAFIDVDATAIIFSAHRRARGEDRQLAIRGAGGQTLRLLTALGLTGDGLLCEPLGREARA